MSYHQKLLQKITNKSAKIAIAGLGYVGLPLAKSIHDAGFKDLIGIDTNKQRVKDLNSCNSPLASISDNELEAMKKDGWKAVSTFQELSQADILIICVPTPLTKSYEPDLSFIELTIESAKPHIHSGMFLCLESTTYPGTTREIFSPIMEQLKLKVGKDVFIGYAPEREDPGNKEFSLQNTRRVVSGLTKNCLEICYNLYSKISPNPFRVTSTETAEITKLLENIQRSVNIGLVNEMKMIADRMDLNIFEIIEAASTKPFGFTKYLPGPGIGGHCIPVDPFYLTWKAKQFGINTRFIELAGQINNLTIDFVISKIIDVLNRQSKSVRNSKLLILGLSYKKDIADLRESPNLQILTKLINLGAKVNYNDPFFPTIPDTRKVSVKLSSITLTQKSISSHDIVIMLTNHSFYDLGMIYKSAKSIVDTRGVFKLTKKVTYA